MFCAQAFHNLIRQKETSGNIQGIVVSPHAPLLTHILFADLTLIFSQIEPEVMMCIQWILCSFARASRLKINLEKTAMAFSKNVPQATKESLTGILGVEVIAKHENYLGLSRTVGRSKSKVFEGLTRRIWYQLQS
ncbi:hypothetical protein Sango_2498700 [Sesamum angolense]|uniref:Reverse transcriptase domain-containing protein n=1 Tax=Sesamum angolense TaxID=2727404 RepID=A0AAE1W3V9_9LAMI|nr:hypothetical protein Sango_2498700 [Sesamum angolense]